jgi:asparagine synthase (glutamine-hydrolysing)
VFASELRPLRSAPRFDPTIDRAALAQYMRRGYVPTPHSIYASIRKLPPGCWLAFGPSTIAERSWPEPQHYWSAVAVAQSSERNLIDVSDSEAVTLLERLLGDAIKGQMLSDVPLGAFLSGGIDSSTVVALMQAQSARPVRTFSVGFEEPEYDESATARAVAAHLGTEHTEIRARGADALALIPRMPRIYDEPFADSSQLPTFLVAQLARAHVTVALSGDGGDELFCGYVRYSPAARAWSVLSRFPAGLRRIAARGVHMRSTAAWDGLAGIARPILPGRYQVAMPGDRIYKAADILACRDFADVYGRMLSQWWLQPLVLETSVSSSASDRALPRLSGAQARMMALDAVTYLPDDILAKVDRAAMAVSLETRVPLLDHRVFELAWRLPLHMKVRGGETKWLLRQVLYRHVPRALIDGPKKGFAVPLASWLRGPLRDWAEDLLAESRLAREGYLDAALVKRHWHEHLQGARNWHYELWNVLMFEAWLREQGAEP